jgi:Uma2 family endonuclease
MLAAAPLNQLTLQEFLALPETKPASEFMDGSIHQKPMPQGQHARLQLKLCNLVNDVAEVAQTGMALPELRCSFGDRSIVPDVAVFRWQRIPFEPTGEIGNAFQLAPDWTIEILSPEQRDTQVIRNILYCLRYGCDLGWLVYPADRTILAFPANQSPVELSGTDLLPLLPELNLSVTVNDVFGLLRSPISTVHG